jgi:putative spermidine/putrescine transport system substrate-binding protein
VGGGIYDLDYWVIPKGTPNRDAAYKFIQFASTADAQAKYAEEISYGPTNKNALTKLHSKTLANLPTAPANAKDSVQFNVKFWADQGEALEKRFASWVAQ